MRRSREDVAQTREAIVTAASERFRQVGMAGSSVNDVMAAAGLTHGGFYRHFKDKEHLINEAVASAARSSLEQLQRNLAKGGIDCAVDRYLSASHRDAETPRCPYAALGSELARADATTKASVSAAVERALGALESAIGESGESRYAAITTLATMIGAMTLARITTASALSDEILEATKQQLHRGP